MTDDDLRQLFHEATADIRPQRTLDDIRSQTKKVDPVARQWFVPSLAAAAAMALVIGGAFWVTQRDGGSDEPGVAAAPQPVDATIYYVGDGARGPRLFTEEHQVLATPESLGLAAAEEAIAGAPVDGDYRSSWPADTTLSDVRLDGDAIQVDFAGAASEPASGMSPAEAAASIDALVRTVQDAYATSVPVRFTVDDAPTDSLLGIDTSTPSTGGDDDEVLALVSISDLVDGATVPTGKLTVTGMASAFEANVAWEILVGGDAVIDSGFATAAECCTLSPFTFTTNIALEGPGAYTLVVHDVDESGEGLPVNRDTKEIVVE